MTDDHRDPLELWVGTWTPEEWITRENRKREQAVAADAKVSEAHPAVGESGEEEVTSA